MFGALAVGFAAVLAAKLCESLIAGMAASLFLASSYTFWSQAITAEVYTLHLLMVGTSSLALMTWADKPSVGRLTLFYGIFALGFGNHLSMVLLLPAFALFLLMNRRPGPSDPLRPRLLLIALAIATLGALQYAWNFRGLWTDLEPPATLGEAMAKFWFDVTKQDWRETLVMTVSETGLQHRPAMYWFDLRQQFGVPGAVLAAIGFLYVLRHWPRRAVLLLILYAANLAFAWTYNVGDAYIFFLPSHYVVALCAGAGVTAIVAASSRMSNRAVASAIGAAVLLYPAWRAYDTFPAVDRSWDDRAVRLLDDLTGRIGDVPVRPQDTVLGLDANWQLQNAVEYYMRERKPEFAWFVTEQLEWLEEGDRIRRFNDFVAANAAINRSVVVTERAAEKVMDSPRYLPRATFASQVKSLEPGTLYALAVLRADQEFELDTAGFVGAWTVLAPGVVPPPLRDYTAVVGRVGEKPVLIESQNRPYRVRLRVESYDFDVRMESWLPTDTIRRAGFGHVIVNRQHALTLERGLSFVALGPGGGPFYSSGLFAPLTRHLVRPQIPNP